MNIENSITDPAIRDLLGRWEPDPAVADRAEGIADLIAYRLANSNFQVFNTVEEYWATLFPEAETTDTTA